MSHITRSQTVESIIPKYPKEKIVVTSSCSTHNKPNQSWSNENKSNAKKLENRSSSFDIVNMPPSHICSIKLILSQLDLIQVHDEQLMKNDKQLCEVIKERDALRLGYIQLKQQLENLRDASSPPVEPEETSRCRPKRTSSPPSGDQSDVSIPRRTQRKKHKRYQERTIVYTERLYHQNNYCYGCTTDPAYKSLDVGGNKLSEGPPSPPQSPDTSPKKLMIPSWRIKSLSAASPTRDDLHEDLSDDTFVKRHQKHECEEKRRKRWDLQMAREQWSVQRLREKELLRQNKNSSTKKEELTSLFPDLSQIHSLEVGPAVPLVVFGSNLPYLPHSEFSLPWK